MKGCLARAVGFVATPHMYCTEPLGTPANIADVVITNASFFKQSHDTCRGLSGRAYSG
jgi:hypothetical protein